jgi:uncharacterized protein
VVVSPYDWLVDAQAVRTVQHPYTMTESETSDCIAEMVDRIVRQFDPIRVILFGSHARGEATRDSDVDLLVVLPEVDDKRAAAVRIRRALADAPLAKDILVTTPEEIECRGDTIGWILRPALREGRVLYERG